MMRLLRILRQRARSLLRGANVDAELARELDFHLEQLTRENVAAGMDPAEARRAAKRALGRVAQLEEQCRDHRRVHGLTDLLKDFAYAWRTLAKSPGFTSLAVITLALGVGASIAVYALAEGLLLRSLPYPEPERLVRLANLHQERAGGFVSQAKFRDWRESSTVFEQMALTTLWEATLTGDGEAERIEGRAVSGGFFELLGVQPALGRWFTAEEHQPGAACVLMASHDFWARRLGARPEAVGDTVVFDDKPCRITGVMPASFRFNESGFNVAEYWIPETRAIPSRQAMLYEAYARLRPGVSIETAQAQMSQIAARLAETYPEEAGWDAQVQSMRARLLEPVADELLILAAAALIVLLAACANVAGLLLARGFGRSREIAVRVALGAGRARVVRLLLAESLLLSGMASLLGAVVAAWLLRVAIAAAPARMELGESVSVSPWLAVFAVALTLAAGLLAGLWPALRASQTRLEGDLRESGDALVAGRRQTRSLQALVVFEAALAVVLLSFVGLLLRSFTHLMNTDLGYRTDRLLTFQIPLPASKYRTAEQRRQFWDALLPQLAAIPGALSVAASDGIPLSGRMSATPVEVEGQTARRDPLDLTARGVIVTPDYFRTMGIPLRQGRSFDESAAAKEPVVIVNEAFVRQLLPDREPIDARVKLGAAPWARIIGVIGDAHYWGAQAAPDPEAYISHAVFPQLQFVSIHTAVPEQTVLAAVRPILQRLDPGLPMTQVRTMRQAVDASLSWQRQMMTVLAGFSGVTLAMAGMGLSGVMLYTVSRRRREIGLRMALGASPGDVSRGVLGPAAKLVAAGSSVGVLAALASGRVLESLLFGVEWYDPATLAAAPAVLAVIALSACVLPLRQAAAVAPMEALRQE